MLVELWVLHSLELSGLLLCEHDKQVPFDEPMNKNSIWVHIQVPAGTPSTVSADAPAFQSGCVNMVLPAGSENSSCSNHSFFKPLEITFYF